MKISRRSLQVLSRIGIIQSRVQSSARLSFSTTSHWNDLTRYADGRSRFATCHRHFSSLSEAAAINLKENPIKILYASTTGTAQLFATQLAEALEEHNQSVTYQPMNDTDPSELLSDPTALYVFVTSTAGVGEFPQNGQGFYDWLAARQDKLGINFVVFGLGNSKAHPNHFNAAAKNLQKRLESLEAKPILTIGLGDDGDSIEDDFDKWQEMLVKVIEGNQFDDKSSTQGDSSAKIQTATSKESQFDIIQCEGAVSKDGKRVRIISRKSPTLKLRMTATQLVRTDLLDCSSFYSPSARRFKISSNNRLSTSPTGNGLCQLRVEIPEGLSYQSGDHFVLYPRNADYIVDALISVLDVQPHAKIEGTIDPSATYPYPTGLTVYETFSHCVDLQATPSPMFARFLLDRTDLDYKKEIANARRTTLDILMESGRSIPLEDLLYNLPPIQPRYYSIASSSKVHPNEIYLTFRPVRYVSSRGLVRQGVCTSYMNSLVPGNTIIGAINDNPTFRLPSDPSTSVVFLAGGCGVAPIRAFLEERIDAARKGTTFGKGILFLGFRDPQDQVYADIVEEALQVGALTEANVTYTTGCPPNSPFCGLVTDALQHSGRSFYDHLQNGGVTYVCGGARMFGVAVENTIHNLLVQHGKQSDEAATAQLRQLIDSGRLCEDLSD